MTSLSQFTTGQRVYVIDESDPYNRGDTQLVVIKVTKGGLVLCAKDDGSNTTFKPLELGIY